MRRIIAYILCVVLLAVMFVGCDSNKKDTKNEKEASSNTEVLADETKEEEKPEEKEEQKQKQEEDDSDDKKETDDDKSSDKKDEPSVKVPAWKTAYLKYIEKNKNGYVSYALISVDNDSIPELYLSGNCEAVGDMVCSCKGGKVVEVHLNRTGGGSYIPKGGLVFNFNGNMGYYTANVYKLTSKGFTNIFYGLQQERVIDLGDGEYEFEYDFFVGDKLVTEQEFYAAINEVFNTAKGRSFSSSSVSYSKIKQQLSNN